MKEEEEDNIDHKFKEGLSKAEDNIAFRNDDWDAMEKLLDEEKRRKGIIFYLPRIITGIAALLLLTLGFFFLRPANKPGANKNDVAIVKPSGTNNNPLNNTKGAKPANNNGSNSDTNNPSNSSTIESAANNGASQLAGNNKKPIDKTSTYTNPSNGNAGVNGSKTGLKDQQLSGSTAASNQLAANSRNKPVKKAGNQSSNSINKGLSNDNNAITGDYIASVPKGTENTPNQTGVSNNPAEVLAASGTNALNNNTGLATADINATDKQLDKNSRTYAAAVIAKQKKKSSFSSYGPTHALVLSVLTAPDLNGVGSSFSNTQVGSTSGLMLSVGLTHRLTVSTGALYAKKPYSADFSQYTTAYPFKSQPSNVYADCRVLDIPINIDYRLYSKGRNMIAVGTGLSSYFMLRENYRFDYGNTPGKASTNFDIKNQNQHILGVLNLNATYQRRINEKFGLNVQPYMKLPLTNIGYGRVDLQSTGVAVGVSWYLTSNRPK
jgi:hypothetical protein